MRCRTGRLLAAVALLILALVPVHAAAQPATYVVGHAEQVNGVDGPPSTEVG